MEPWDRRRPMRSHPQGEALAPVSSPDGTAVDRQGHEPLGRTANDTSHCINLTCAGRLRSRVSRPVRSTDAPPRLGRGSTRRLSGGRKPRPSPIPGCHPGLPQGALPGRASIGSCREAETLVRSRLSSQMQFPLQIHGLWAPNNGSGDPVLLDRAAEVGAGSGDPRPALRTPAGGPGQDSRNSRSSLVRLAIRRLSALRIASARSRFFCWSSRIFCSTVSRQMSR